MKVEFRKSFIDDLEHIENKNIKQRVRRTIEQVEQARTLHERWGIKKLHDSQSYYRIRIGDYRLGLVVRGDTVVFVRFLHRKEVYRYFP